MARADPPLDYIKRTRYYYQRLGYGEPYDWAQYADIPFTPLRIDVSNACVTIVTTAAPYQEDMGDQGPGAPHNGSAKFFDVYSMPTNAMPDLRISHIAYDRDHTTASDIGSYFPLKALQEAASEQRIGRIAKRFYGLPTNRSKRITLEKDCQQLLSLCREDKVDLALLVPNCPVCHQSVSLAARTLEAAGLPTVVMGCAKDIVERVGVPRFLFSDFPLGNSAGLPDNEACQKDTLSMALKLAASASAPATTKTSPYQWSGAANWKEDYSNPDKLSESELSKRRKAFDDTKKAAKQKNRSK